MAQALFLLNCASLCPSLQLHIFKPHVMARALEALLHALRRDAVHPQLGILRMANPLQTPPYMTAF